MRVLWGRFEVLKKRKAMPRELSGVVGDRYTVIKPLGAGGMGSVYEVKDDKTGRSRALKTLLPELGRDPDMLQRFQAEIDALKRICHPNVIEIADVGFDPQQGFPFLVMELLEGEDLEALMTLRGRFDERTALKILLQIASALDAVHDQNIVHRDLKPSNVFIRRRHDGLAEVKLLDFGVAKLMNTGAANTTAIVGTPGYMAPEQLDGRGIDRRTDIYALGRLARALLYRSSLPDPGGAEQGQPSAAFDAWFERATHMDKNKRFERASVAIDALATALSVPRNGPSFFEWSEVHGGTARGVALEAAARPNAAPTRQAPGLARLALGALGIAGLFWWLGSSRSREPTSEIQPVNATAPLMNSELSAPRSLDAGTHVPPSPAASHAARAPIEAQTPAIPSAAPSPAVTTRAASAPQRRKLLPERPPQLPQQESNAKGNTRPSDRW